MLLCHPLIFFKTTFLKILSGIIYTLYHRSVKHIGPRSGHSVGPGPEVIKCFRAQLS